MPYSSPASSYAPIGKVEVAYIEMINGQGGVSGRKIKLLSLDDGYSPPKTVEQTRKLVAWDHRFPPAWRRPDWTRRWAW
jgi:branched-chain amino acid transport system substrate-binding protein